MPLPRCASLPVRNAARAQARPANDPPAAPRSYIARPPDTLLFLAVTALVGIGLVMIYSASSATAYAQSGDTAYFVKRQFLWLIVGAVMAFGAYRIDYHKLKNAAPYLLVASALSLLLVLVPHVGLAVNGA
ncbi:MAG: FtsW/RodA/SpoVE family cell cycle protein, partial [Vulcanimicrobiaceae bacterium]